MYNLKKNQLTRIHLTLESFKSLLSIYDVIKNDSEKLKEFCSLHRNPIWDITSIKLFDTGLISEEGKKQSKKNLVSDHYIQRSKATKFIFDNLSENPNMNIDEFIDLLKKYGSTIKLTKEEHSIVTNFAKKNKQYLNYEIYGICGINIIGLSKVIGF
jgi:hypothetical protein